MTGASRLTLASIALAFLSGCAHRPNLDLPTYSWRGESAALKVLQDRAKSVRSVSASALLTLTRPDGQSVRLDGAIVMSPPDRSVRLRAWKFGQAVFDLTLTPAGLWIEMPRDAKHRDQIAPASLSAAQLARAISLFGGDVFEGPGVSVEDRGGPTFRIRKPLEDGRTMIAEIDRPTLTPLRYRLTATAGVLRFMLSLSDYRMYSGIAWPTRMLATSESGRIEVELRDVELNGELPPEAFVPPHGAEKMP
jgi:hypothetical protein